MPEMLWNLRGSLPESFAELFQTNNSWTLPVKIEEDDKNTDG